MTQGNNLVITISGTKGDGKTTLGLYYLEMLDKPSIIIDVTQQFDTNRTYRKLVTGVTALRYELLNTRTMRLFKKAKLQLIFRPNSQDIKKEVEEVISTIINNNIQNINIFFDELEIYANNRLNEKSSIFQLFYMSRNRNINIISVVKIMGMLSPLIKAQTDYFALSQINDTNSYKYFSDRSKGQIKTYLEGIKQHEFLVTDLVKYWRFFKLKKSSLRVLEKKKTI